jgi:hypothetical protein
MYKKFYHKGTKKTGQANSGLMQVNSLGGISTDHEIMNAFTLSPRGYSFLYTKFTSCLRVFVAQYLSVWFRPYRVEGALNRYMHG